MSMPPGYNLLAQYPNEYFVETGSYLGDAVQLAIEAGFKKIRTIDIDWRNVVKCKQRFALATEETIFLTGDSSTDLGSMIQDITEPITFWLDAHWMPGAVIDDKSFPLLKEIQQIAQHPIKTHTIIIDDWYLWEWVQLPYTREDVVKKIYAINSDYQIKYIDNPTKDGILISTV